MLLNTNSKIKHSLLFTLFLLLCALLFHWFEILTLEPMGSHVWRQTDSLSIIQNYFYDHQSFWEPRTNDYRMNFQDISLTEFPLLYYISAWIWNWTGEVYWVPRVINLTVFMCGIWALYRIAKRFIDQPILVYAFLFLVLSSSSLMHYALNFIPNAPAIGLSFLAWHFFIRYWDNNKLQHLALACLFLTVSCLLKVTLLFSFVILICCALYLFWKERNKSRLLYPLLFLGLGILLIFLWTTYLKGYNKESAAAALFESFSIFTHSWAEMKDVWENGFKAHWILLETRPFWFVLACMIVYNFYTMFRLRHYLLLLIHLLFIGSSAAYFALFFLSFNNHDYYLLDFIPHIAVHLLTFVYYFSRLETKKTLKVAFVMCAFGLMCLASGHVVTRNLAVSKGFAKLQSHLVDRYSFGFHQYFRFTSLQSSPLRNYRTKLRTLGINRHTPVICLPDPSPNISLYYYNLRGQTNMHVGFSANELCENLKKGEPAGYNFLILDKGKDLLLDSLLRDALSPAIWQDERVAVFSLQLKNETK